MKFTAEHKSLAAMPSRHELVPVRPNGQRDLTFEGEVGFDGEVLMLRDNDPIVRLELSPEGLEFLVAHLPDGDGFTEHLRYMQALAPFKLWDRAIR